MNGDTKTGVSIMKIEEKLDSGPVLSVKELDLDQNATYGEIEKKLSVIGASLLIESLKKIENSKAKFIDQVHSEATYAKKIIKVETKINWNLDANKVIRHIHGLSPNPGAWFEYKNERFKVLRANKSSVIGKPGTVLDENLTIACKSDSIQILEIQRQGKNKQTVKEFFTRKKNWQRFNFNLMQRYKIKIEYDGTPFVGWQFQKNGHYPFKKYYKMRYLIFPREKVVVTGAGRTDSGVHALAQIAHFDLKKKINKKKLFTRY